MSSISPQPVRFSFTQGHSEMYGSILRPGAKVYIRTARASWLPHFMLVDSGADYTLLPRTIGEFLGFRKDSEDRIYRAGGVGGGDIWVIRRRVRMRIGRHAFPADVGWANFDNVPLLLGRADVFDRFEVRFRQIDRLTEFHWRG